MRPWETLLPWKSKEISAVSTRCPTLQHPYKYQGDVIANSMPYMQFSTDAPTRARNSFFGSRVTRFVRDPPRHIETPTWISTRRSTSKGGTRNGLLIALLEESRKEYLKRLCKQTPLWLFVMSRSLRNPEECFYETPYVAAPIGVPRWSREFYALRATSYRRTYKSQNSFFGSQVTHLVRDPSHHIETPTWISIRRSTSKGGTGNRLLITLPEESREEYLKRLCKQTLLWLIVMSRSLRNPEEQDVRKKRDVSIWLLGLISCENL
jgi:hypothetical protein